LAKAPSHMTADGLINPSAPPEASYRLIFERSPSGNVYSIEKVILK